MQRSSEMNGTGRSPRSLRKLPESYGHEGVNEVLDSMESFATVLAPLTPSLIEKSLYLISGSLLTPKK